MRNIERIKMRASLHSAPSLPEIPSVQQPSRFRASATTINNNNIETNHNTSTAVKEPSHTEPVNTSQPSSNNNSNSSRGSSHGINIPPVPIPVVAPVPIPVVAPIGSSNRNEKKESGKQDTTKPNAQQDVPPIKKSNTEETVKPNVEEDKPVKGGRQMNSATGTAHSHSTSSKPNKNNQQKKEKKESKDDSLLSRITLGTNTRSETYRRDFIKANPPLKIPFVGEFYSCGLCFKPVRKEKMHVDHIFPVSKGGSNSTKNLGALCAPCNLSKSDKVDSRVARMYIRKFGGSVLGVPIALAFGAATGTIKYTAKGLLWTGKHALSLGFKALSVGISKFLGAGFKIQAVVIIVVILFLASQGLLNIGIFK